VINCPFCNHGESWVKETKSRPGVVRRYRVCRMCNKTFCTHELVAFYKGKKLGMMLYNPFKEPLVDELETDE
jgi:transcriptional regulator NrdR family protein